MAPTLKSTPRMCARKSRTLNWGIWYFDASTPTSANARGPICPLGTPIGSAARCDLPQPAQRPLYKRYSCTSAWIGGMSKT